VDLVKRQRDTLASLLQKCLSHNAASIEVDLFPSQILCLANQVQFTEKVEEMMPQGLLSKISEDLLKTFQSLSSLDFSVYSQVAGLKVKALVLDMIHQRDVLDELIKDGSRNTSDWIWNKQLRYYVSKGCEDCNVRICAAECDYTYEYQGNQVSKLNGIPSHFL